MSDRNPYNDLLFGLPATSLWPAAPHPGTDAIKPEFYERLELTVDSQQQALRRSARKTGLTYTMHIGEAVHSGKPVLIRQAFRTATPA